MRGRTRFWVGWWCVCLGLGFGCVEDKQEQARPAPDDPALVGVLFDEEGQGEAIEVPPGVYTAGVPSTDFEPPPAPNTWGRQRRVSWCWAATAQMIVHFQGVPVVFEEVVAHLYGGFVTDPASSVAEIAAALDGWAGVDGAGQMRTIQASPVEVLDVTEVLGDLHFERPVMLALDGEDVPGAHTYVLSAVRYRANGFGQLLPISAELRDPWPDHPEHLTVAWSEVVARFVGYVRVDVL